MLERLYTPCVQLSKSRRLSKISYLTADFSLSNMSTVHHIENIHCVSLVRMECHSKMKLEVRGNDKIDHTHASGWLEQDDKLSEESCNGQTGQPT